MGGRLNKLLWVALAALILRTCVIEPVHVSDDSMQPVLANGDGALVSKLHYGIRVPGAGAMLVEWSRPKIGDLVVVVSVGDPPVSLMRRIEALPGDKVLLPDGSETTLQRNEYFVVAEKKEEVMDSRRFGPVLRRSIIGKVTHTWFAKSSSSETGSGVESEKSSWRMLQPIL